MLFRRSATAAAISPSGGPRTVQWTASENGSRLDIVPVLLAFAFVSGLVGCRVLTSGLTNQGATSPQFDGAAMPAFDNDAVMDQAVSPAVDEPGGIAGTPDMTGCSDGTREGFRDLGTWINIAGCAGGFDQPGVMGTPDLATACDRNAGNTSANPNGTKCSAADLCAAGWRVCRNGDDVSAHSASGCESCVLPGEPRFFLVASGASPMGVCSPDLSASNDLHGCGGLGDPESEDCSPLIRRMGFADCLATNGVWWCGNESESLQEAKVVIKPGVNMGGALCCREVLISPSLDADSSSAIVY